MHLTIGWGAHVWSLYAGILVFNSISINCEVRGRGGIFLKQLFNK